VSGAEQGPSGQRPTTQGPPPLKSEQTQQVHKAAQAQQQRQVTEQAFITRQDLAAKAANTNTRPPEPSVGTKINTTA
jgi:hypothetical protein